MPSGFGSELLYYLLPELILATGLLAVLVADLFTPRRRERLVIWVSVGILVATLAALATSVGVNTTIARGSLAIDGFSLFFKVLFLLAAILTILMSVRYLEVEDVRPGEYCFLILCATLGMMFLASGIDLVTIFIGLETMAIAFYILAGYLKPNRQSNEAAVKYFLLGAFSLGILLYGMSILYGLSGSTHLRSIATALSGPEQGPLLVLGVILVVAGIAFKIAAVPFHMWAPDVYEGAPTPVTAFLSVGSKAASFAMLLRICLEGLPGMIEQWQILFYALAVASMVVGNIAALTQSNLKRMLAYSSIAHAGYVLIGVVAATPRGVAAALIYMAVYAFMQLGAFAVIVLMRRSDAIGDELKDLSGLFSRNPVTAIAMLVFMLSLGGIPPTAGFMGKFWIFSAAIEAGFVWLAVIGVLTSAVSLYYYIRVVVFMWIKEETFGSPVIVRPAMAVTLAVTLAATLALGVYPQWLFELADVSARSLGAGAVALVP